MGDWRLVSTQNRNPCLTFFSPISRILGAYMAFASVLTGLVPFRLVYSLVKLQILQTLGKLALAT